MAEKLRYTLLCAHAILHRHGSDVELSAADLAEARRGFDANIHDDAVHAFLQRGK